MSHDLPTAARLSALVVEALQAVGVTHVVLCPGSRSAPLAYAVDASPLPLLVRIDERVAGFTALGIGRAGGLAAVVTTSGTAVANLHPAVLEAHHAGVPLVVLSADRPPSLRGTWANQTSELQAHLFGGALRALLDLDDVAAAADPGGTAALVRTCLLAASAGSTAPGGSRRPGPVQLNLGLSEPLLPPRDAPPSGPASPLVRTRPAPAGPPALQLAPGPRTVVVAGDGDRRDGSRATQVAERAGWPLLAEPTSGARGGPQAIGPYRLLLEQPGFGDAVERVVVTGRPTLSRPVSRLLADPAVEVVLLGDHDDWPDPGRAVTRARAVAVHEGGRTADERWWHRWRQADAASRTALDEVLEHETDAGAGLSGLILAREVAAATGPGQVLVAGSSNPVRDLDLVAHPRSDRPLAALANRGLAGIDGTVATATGVALSGRHAAGPVLVLLGDLALLHDVGALLADPGALAEARSRGLPEPDRPHLQVVVLDDGGGGIFSLLEYGQRAAGSALEAARFERLFGTPHQVDLVAVCRGYGVPADRVADLPALRSALASPPSGTSVLVVPADRGRLRGLHAAVRAAVATAAQP